MEKRKTGTSVSHSETEKATPKKDINVTSPTSDADERLTLAELDVAMEEVDFLIAFLSKSEDSDLKDLQIDVLLNARACYRQEGRLSPEQETAFWKNYRLALQHSNGANLGVIKSRVRNSDEYAYGRHHLYNGLLQKHMKIYGIAACLWILLLLCIQTYYLVGKDVVVKTKELFVERNEVRNELAKKGYRLKLLGESIQDNDDYLKLIDQEQVLDQQFDANRIILIHWNLYWRLGQRLVPEFSLYDSQKYNLKIAKLEEEIAQLKSTPEDSETLKRKQQELSQTHVNRTLNESRNIFFRNTLSADYVLSLLQSYVLPIMYGCLGAFTLILRNIYREFRTGALRKRSYWDCNLRILLGGIAAMFAGTLLADSQSSISSVGDGLPPMLLAFLIGYNVDILFLLLDKLARSSVAK